MLVGRGAFPAWIVAAIVARELLVSGLRIAALQRGVVMSARDLAKIKTAAQALAVCTGGLTAGGAVSADVAWGAAVAALVLTWVSGLDYARIAPRVLRGRQAA